MTHESSAMQPPVLVLWGRHDKILPPETAQKFADALPSATVQASS